MWKAADVAIRRALRYGLGMNEHVVMAVGALPGSVTERAHALGVHRTTVHRWMSGRSVPRESEWERLSVLLGVPVGVLRYGPTPVLRSLLPRPRLTRAEAVAHPGADREVAVLAGVSRSTIRRWRATGGA